MHPILTYEPLKRGGRRLTETAEAVSGGHSDRGSLQFDGFSKENGYRGKETKAWAQVNKWRGGELVDGVFKEGVTCGLLLVLVAWSCVAYQQGIHLNIAECLHLC
jgi:hypothetical protein